MGDNGAQRLMVMVIQHSVPFDKAVVLELLHLTSMHMHTGSIGLFNGALCFNYLYYKAAFSVFFFILSCMYFLTDTRKLKSYNYFNLPNSLM